MADETFADHVEVIDEILKSLDEDEGRPDSQDKDLFVKVLIRLREAVVLLERRVAASDKSL